jgi:hypothetical protein
MPRGKRPSTAARTGHIVSKDLNSGNGFATRALPHGLKAFFAEGAITQADRFEFCHLELKNKRYRNHVKAAAYFPIRVIAPRSSTSA